MNYSTLISVPGDITMDGDLSKLNFTNGTLVDAQINNGQITCMGNTWFKKDIVNASTINLPVNKVTIFTGNITADNIVANHAIVVIANDNLVISGDLTSQNLLLDLRSHKLQYSGIMTGKLNIHTFYNHQALSGGNIQLTNGSKIDLAGEDLTVKIIAISDINNLQVGGYNLISSQNGSGVINLGSIILDSSAEQNQFVRWTLDVNNMTLYPRDISNEILRRRFSDASLEEQQFIE